MLARRIPSLASARPLGQYTKDHRAVALRLQGSTLTRNAQRFNIHSTASRQDLPQWPNPPVPQPVATPYQDPRTGQGGAGGGGKGPGTDWKTILENLSTNPLFGAMLTTVIGLAAVFGGGVGYLAWYKAHVLNKMMHAFDAGYDPVLELGKYHQKKRKTPFPELDPNDPAGGATSSEDGSDRDEEDIPTHILRKEHSVVDSIVKGEATGAYWLIIGSKGTGKGTMIIDAMRDIKAEGAAFCEAHSDLEVFRLRLGKALHYEYHEDWQGGLFSRADPREGGPALDIERAMNKLEKVAMRYTLKNGRPIVLVFNNIHLLPNNEEGYAMIHQLQQRAEAWAEAGICSMVFSTDDYLLDLNEEDARKSLRFLRSSYAPNHGLISKQDRDQIPEILKLIGGRTSYLSRVARADDMLEEAKNMVEVEKNWMLSKVGMTGQETDDDVMDDQNCTWLLMKEFVKIREEAKEEAEKTGQPFDETETPKMSYYKARQVMTRGDFMPQLDHINCETEIDHSCELDNLHRCNELTPIRHKVNHHVRPDSMIIYQAGKLVVEEEGFDDLLDETRDRVDEIEGLHRQSELTVKEPFRINISGGSLWSWLWPGKTKMIEVEGLGASFIPAEKDDGKK
ncbi:hypothetical protein QFC21_000932 [Naganishia friedmannii]|uniref:Uncharacterized protein n=1 Tax=Naganishia friedmannii TaxID=89922 RepID=A0ACC2W8E9_9TREE|nr:hypothetical protein QFC21_000932 [Naganishia friedmannii]